MLPILYTNITEGTIPTNFGAGVLTDCLSCEVKEERNGSYELTLVYAAQGIHAEDIVPDACILAKPNFTDDPQLFRIYKIGKEMNGRVEVRAQHISYDLSGKVITSGTATSCVGACSLLDSAAGDFTITTDKVVTADFEIKEPSSVRSWFGGKSGSLLDVYGTAEWHFDNFTCALKLHRGSDRGVQIRYGKNLTQLKQDIGVENLITSITPYYIDSETGTKVIGDKVTTDLESSVLRDVAMDFSDSVDIESGVPILDQLQALAERYINNNIVTRAISNITLDFVQISTLAERVDLCDTVTVIFEPLGISASVKCVSTTWDVLHDRYTSTTFGDAKSDITDTLVKNEKQIAERVTMSDLTKSVNHATELITGNLGGYVVIHDSNNDGYPDELLIMNTDDISTAAKVWRWNNSGLGYSSTGYNGTFGTAITANGEIVADFITTGTLSANLIKGGVLKLGSNLNQSGTMEVYDAANNLIAQLDKSGLKLIGSDGFYLVANPVDGFAGFDANDTKLFWITQDEFHMKKSVVEEEITLCNKMRFIPIELYDQNDVLVNDGIGLVSLVF
jgi:phage minor structural protein